MSCFSCWARGFWCSFFHFKMLFPEPRGSRKRLQLFLQSQTKGKIQARRSSKANSPFPAALGCFWQVISLLIRGRFQPPAPPKDGNRAGSRGGAQQSGNVILSSEQLPRPHSTANSAGPAGKPQKTFPGFSLAACLASLLQHRPSKGEYFAFFSLLSAPPTQ